MMRDSRSKVLSRQPIRISGAIEFLVFHRRSLRSPAAADSLQNAARKPGMLIDPTFHSSSVSLPCLSRIVLETLSFPMSCSNAARRTSCTRSGSRPICCAMPSAASATPIEWQKVKCDLASTTSANASQIRSICVAPRCCLLAGSRSSAALRVSSWALAGGAMLPQRISAMQRDCGPHKFRIEPAATPLLQCFNSSLSASAGEEHVQVLRDCTDTREQRNPFPLRTLRIAAAVPMLIQAADGLCRDPPHAEFRDDTRASLAAQGNHLLGVLVLVRADADNTSYLRRRACIREHVLPEEPQRRCAGFMQLGPNSLLDLRPPPPDRPLPQSGTYDSHYCCSRCPSAAERNTGCSSGPKEVAPPRRSASPKAGPQSMPTHSAFEIRANDSAKITSDSEIEPSSSGSCRKVEEV